ncbi:MAG: DUF5522 domain-containing protein [Janthinobacterium lividum]
MAESYPEPDGEARVTGDEVCVIGEGAWVTGGDLQPGDAYMEGEFLVFTAQYHLHRGYCCNSGCRHCPYRET